MYEPMPESRPHPCTEQSAANIPIAWIEHTHKHGFELVATNVYGEITGTDINFCPFCGERLAHEKPAPATVTGTGKL